MNTLKDILKKKMLIIVIGLAWLTLFLALIFFSLSPKRTTQDIPEVLPSESVVEPDDQVQALPIRLTIPKIGVDAMIEQMSTTPNGDMEAPAKGRNVGWFRFGPYPGETGSAVIAGHYGRWKNGEGSVFDTLHRLEAGDTIFVENTDGITTEFVVRESRDYDPQADAEDVFSSDDDLSHLNLITCEGIWNETSQSYDKRLIVFADKI